MNPMKTPYERKQIERIIAAQLARHFSGSVTEAQVDMILAAQAKKQEAENELRQAVNEVCQAIMR